MKPAPCAATRPLAYGRSHYATTCARRWRTGCAKVSLWADRHGAGTARFSSDHGDPFFNINRPEDIDMALRQMAGPDAAP